MQPGWESAPQSSKLFRVASRFVTGLLLAAAFRAVCQQGAPPEQDFLRGIAAHPRDPHTRSDYGIFLQQQGRAAEAIAQFRAALEFDPRSPDAAYNLALALFGEGRAAEALTVFDEHPANTADHFALRGAALNTLQRPADAVPALRRAVALDPGNPDFLYDLALTLLKIDASAEGARLLESGRRRFPRVAKFHAGVGMVAYLNGKNDEAVQAYESAVKLEPNAADFYAALGDVRDATGDLARAGAAYSQALRLDSSVAAYHVKYGRNLAKLQRPREAEAAFLDALARDPANADAHFQLGKLLIARDDHASALSQFEQAVRANPSLKEAWYQLGLGYRREGMQEKALAAMEQFRKLQ